MFSDKNKIDETSGLSFIVICDNKIIFLDELNLAFNIISCKVSITYIFLSIKKYTRALRAIFLTIFINLLLQLILKTLSMFFID